MKHKLLTSLLVSALCAGGARAQDAAPVTPAPAPAPASELAAATAATPALPAPTQIVYSPKLPTVSELQSAAAAQGLGIDRVVQTATQVIAFYRAGNGQTSTVAYQTLPPSGQPQTVAPAPAPAPAPQTVMVAPPPTIIYQTAPRVIYYDDYPDAYYYPRYWSPPVSLSFGFGYHSYHGGYRHWR